MQANVEERLYIVNFEDEAGYAILGADDRSEPVYAVVDEGSLTTEDFRYAVTVTDEQAQADGKFVFPLQLVAQAAIIGIENADTDADGGGVAPMSDDGRHTGDLGGDVLRREYVYVTQEKIGPLIPVKWGQSYPFNACCPLVHGQYPLAGCTAVALAQILASNYWHYGSAPSQIKKYTIDWNTIRRAIVSPSLLGIKYTGDKAYLNPLTPEGSAVAKLIAAVGNIVNMDYGLDGSGADLTDAQLGLCRYLNYQEVYTPKFNEKDVKAMIKDRQKPTMMSGFGYHTTTGKKAGHTWNLDGLFDRTRYIKTYYRNGTTSLKDPVPQTLIHCNFGWNGICDGYYYFGNFDTTKAPADLEDEFDENLGTQPYNFKLDLRMMTYAKIS